MVAQYIIGGILMALALVLIVVILKQTGKDKGVSGTITGGSADTYFGKTGGSTKEKLLTRITIVASALFVILSVVLTILTVKG